MANTDELTRKIGRGRYRDPEKTQQILDATVELYIEAGYRGYGDPPRIEADRHSTDDNLPAIRKQGRNAVRRDRGRDLDSHGPNSWRYLVRPEIDRGGVRVHVFRGARSPGTYCAARRRA